MRAKKRFGQHFLRDTGIIHKIVQALDPKPTDCLIEIGPGLGALTQPLLQKTGQLHVIEIDRDVIPELERIGSQYGALTIHQQDALTVDLSSFSHKPNSIRLIGNLPYNISSPLLFHVLTFSDLIDDMYFMLQKEVVDRICAQPGDTNYGRLSVMIQYMCNVRKLFDVNPACFAPPPKVMSSVLCLKPYREKPAVAEDEALLAEIVRLAFGQRRKTLRNTLKEYCDEAGFQYLNINPQSRAQDLSVSDFVSLANFLKKQT